MMNLTGSRGPVILIVLMVMISCVPQERINPLTKAYEMLVEALGDPACDTLQRQKAAFLLSKGDENAIPVLINYLNDKRIYKRDYVGLNETSDNDRIVPGRVMSVGEMCECLLYEIVFRGARVPENAKVKDWYSWWEKNKHKSLREIREEVPRYE